ncbi:hypothetical protein [Stenomitos frigidus]|uniref:hypothetical protein n=1 Tax=Stenomitos frigidus TaxID=1886765 RepID=UPI0015E72C51|nr:hypothetical protein [Stenomitos frigidus]
MAFFKPLFQLGMLFVLTALTCWVLVNFLQASPLCGIGFFCASMMAILLTVDAL